MKRSVGDTETIRTQNRGLVLEAIRRLGPLSRTQLATATGLSNATITAISTDMISQSILSELLEPSPELKTRGRPSTRVGFKRDAGYAILMEIDVNQIQCSLVDFDGTLVDRTSSDLQPNTFQHISPIDFIAERVEFMRQRNTTESERIMRVSVSVQGILDRDNHSVKWSPVPFFAGYDLVDGIAQKCHLPLTLYKRGRLLAEGARWLFPELYNVNVATVFLGATVAMGISLHGQEDDRGRDAATEFGHMNHVPDGALCRCGMSGCIEAYAADYAILRSAYGVKETAPPAAAVPAQQYNELVTRAYKGDRTAVHAFNIAGSAIGFGISRLMTVFDTSHIAIIGPGAVAFPLMQTEVEAAISKSLVAQVHGMPKIVTHNDECEPVFKGLTMKTLSDLDQIDFAGLPTH